ncbi:hypothetical protein KR51_00029840 [Rubidibacter lacunae KORDI 51-2]|uniref:Uncharacterized protein n=1 Tax=Rubidibacter lacunae KORDI 51-2 TaxID=582515 RepID=U5D716_9CHRO|nr:hypothetical protein KR51_00029840 [Rubidibacter lacunae KORDI 51-2]
MADRERILLEIDCIICRQHYANWSVIVFEYKSAGLRGFQNPYYPVVRSQYPRLLGHRYKACSPCRTFSADLAGKVNPAMASGQWLFTHRWEGLKRQCARAGGCLESSDSGATQLLSLRKRHGGSSSKAAIGWSSKFRLLAMPSLPRKFSQSPSLELFLARI